jgi:microcystin degradation protein MlrC
MLGWSLPRRPGEDATCEGARVGVLLVQQESNSFAIRPSTLDGYTILAGPTTDDRLAGANSEFAGACAEIRRRGGRAEPLLYAHALPAGPLDDDAYGALLVHVDRALRDAPALDGLVVCLHGALATTSNASADAAMLGTIRELTGSRIPIALSLDLHANATPGLVGLADVVTGYHTNPHVDLADTGRRAAALLSAVLSGHLTPTVALSTCPAIFPDQSLRIPDGTLGHVLADLAHHPAARGPFADVSVFPTQPWLDAPGIGFTAVVTADADEVAAARLARAITGAVWERRRDFVADRLTPVDEVLTAAERASVRPFVVSEAADAPTAGAMGDGTGMLRALAAWRAPRTSAITVLDPPAVAACWEAGVGAALTLRVGATLDPRWGPPAELAGVVAAIGEGEHPLTGVGYHGMVVSMGQFAVLRCGPMRVLLTERPAWSADPGTWRHAGIDPDDVDVLVVRSCTDYLANFPAAAATSLVADVPGAATPRLSRLSFRRCDVVPFPVDPSAVW